MSRITWCCLVLLAAAACAAVEQAPGEKVAVGDGVSVGRLASHGNLAVFPLYLDKTEVLKENYITLEEALELKGVEVREVGSGRSSEQVVSAQPVQEQPLEQPEDAQANPAQRQVQQEFAEQVAESSAGAVNAVEIENKSDRPLYILAGQVILGGKQDRVITKDTVVPPGQKMQVEVCCVEQGRWSPSRDQSGNVTVAFAGASSGNIQSNIRGIVQAKGGGGQSEVWEEVAKSADKLDAEASTGTYRQVMEKTEKTVDEYLDVLRTAFESDGKICGFVACVNGEVVTCDLFTSPELLRKFEKSLLRQYVLDALNAGEAEDAKAASAESVTEFMREMQQARKNSETLAEDKHRRVDKIESDKVMGFGNAPCVEGDYMELHMNAYSKKK
jgi:hypothetical protein